MAALSFESPDGVPAFRATRESRLLPHLKPPAMLLVKLLSDDAAHVLRGRCRSASLFAHLRDGGKDEPPRRSKF